MKRLLNGDDKSLQLREYTTLQHLMASVCEYTALRPIANL